MRILALETSETAGSAAALVDDKLLAQLHLDSSSRSAQSLAPTLAALWDRVGWRPTDVELVAVGVGPGSFTGLRVGVVTAKMLAYSAGAAVFGVDTLEAIAEQAPAEIKRLSVAVDAQRGQVVACNYERVAGRLQPSGPAALLDSDAWLAGLPDGCAVSGPIVRRLLKQLPARLAVVDSKHWTPQAETIGRIAYRRFAAGERCDVWRLAPVYSRRAAAEEKWEAARRASAGS